MKSIRVVLCALFIGFVVIQFYPVDRSNPPVVSDISAPPEVKSILKRACYDCHSHKTKWPWYAYVAPASWLVTHDVEEARSEMNFSTWDKYSPKKQQKLIHEIWEEAEEGEMPLWEYLLTHPKARLSDEEVKILESWQSPYVEDK